MNIILSFLVALSLAGCASFLPDKISTTPTGGGLPIPITSQPIIKDLESTAFNLDRGVEIGALLPTDPAPKCLHDFLQRAGIEPIPGAAPIQSFEPKNDGLISAGSIVYIQIRQAQVMSGQVQPVAVDCKTLIGTFVIDGAIGFAKLLPQPLLLRLPR
jgi:hypothetical protein